MDKISKQVGIKRQVKGAKRGRKPLDLKTYIAQSQIRIREFKNKSKDQSRPIQERKKWRSCASALKTRLAIRVYREDKQNAANLESDGGQPEILQ